VADQISLQPGFPPWQPAADAQLAKTYNFYDMPLIGLIQQAGAVYLFLCVEGHAGPENLWAYALIQEEERTSLDRVSQHPEEFDSNVRTLVADRPLVVAVAREGHGIVSSALIEQPDRYRSLLEAAIEAFRSTEVDLERFQAATTD
jgi:hypothetical protein